MPQMIDDSMRSYAWEKLYGNREQLDPNVHAAGIAQRMRSDSLRANALQPILKQLNADGPLANKGPLTDQFKKIIGSSGDQLDASGANYLGAAQNAKMDSDANPDWPNMSVEEKAEYTKQQQHTATLEALIQQLLKNTGATAPTGSPNNSTGTMTGNPTTLPGKLSTPTAPVTLPGQPSVPTAPVTLPGQPSVPAAPTPAPTPTNPMPPAPPAAALLGPNPPSVPVITLPPASAPAPASPFGAVKPLPPPKSNGNVPNANGTNPSQFAGKKHTEIDPKAYPMEWVKALDKHLGGKGTLSSSDKAELERIAKSPNQQLADSAQTTLDALSMPASMTKGTP